MYACDSHGAWFRALASTMDFSRRTELGIAGFALAEGGSSGNNEQDGECLFHNLGYIPIFTP